MSESLFPHHQRARPSRVTLTVENLDRSVGFYEQVIGLACLERGNGKAVLGSEASTFLQLNEVPDATRRPNAAGLFHFAILVPTRGALGAAIERMGRLETPLTGAADHNVSEAIYLDDPDGHGIEIYRDRPVADWYRDGEFLINNDRLDLIGLRAIADTNFAQMLPAETILGHVHLEVLDLTSARAFYQDQLVLDLMASRPQAHFLGWRDYHHHLAVNTWNGRRELPAKSNEIGLQSVTFASESVGAPRRLRDSSGIEMILEPLEDLEGRPETIAARHEAA